MENLRLHENDVTTNICIGPNLGMEPETSSTAVANATTALQRLNECLHSAPQHGFLVVVIWKNKCNLDTIKYYSASVRRRWRPVGQNKKSEVELVLQANYIEVCNAQRSEVIATAPDIKDCFNEFWAKYEACPLKGRDRILAAVAPQVIFF